MKKFAFLFLSLWTGLFAAGQVPAKQPSNMKQKAIERVDVADFGAGPWNKDNKDQIQKAIDYALDNNIPEIHFSHPYYKVRTGLLLLKDKNRDGKAEFFNVRLTGTHGTYNNLGTTIEVLDSTTFALGIQWGKGVEVYDLTFVGQNKANLKPQQVMEGIKEKFSTCSNKRFAPYAGIVIDPFHATAPDKYPGFEKYYTNTGRGGSTDIKIARCSFSKFTVCIVLSPNGRTQNAESIKITDVWVGYCLYGVSISQSQSRDCTVTNLKCWSPCYSVFDLGSYGEGNGVPPVIQGGNIAGAVYQVFSRFNTPWGAGHISDLECESIYRIGEIGNPSTPYLLTNCKFHLQNFFPKTNNVFTGCGNFNNCTIRYYDNLENMLPALTGCVTLFSGKNQLSSPIIPYKWQNNDELLAEYQSGIIYEQSALYPTGYLLSDVHYYVRSGQGRPRLVGKEIYIDDKKDKKGLIQQVKPLMSYERVGLGEIREQGKIIVSDPEKYKVGDRIVVFYVQRYPIDGTDQVINQSVIGVLRKIEGKVLDFGICVKMHKEPRVTVGRILYNSIEF